MDVLAARFSEQVKLTFGGAEERDLDIRRHGIWENTIEGRAALSRETKRLRAEQEKVLEQGNW